MHAASLSGLWQVTSVTWPLVVESAFDATVILTVAGLVALGLRAASASMRHRVWAVAIACLLVLPLVRWLLPEAPLGLRIAPRFEVAGESFGAGTERRPWHTAPANTVQAETSLAHVAWTGRSEVPSGDNSAATAPTRDRTMAHATAERPSLAIPAPASSPVRDGGETRAAGPRLPWAALSVLVWVTGVGLGLASFAGSLLAARRLVRKAEGIRDPAWQRLAEELGAQLGLRPAVLMVASRQAVVPLTVGWLRPRIVMPESCRAWPDERRRVVLAHELMHVARRDVLWQMAARLACAIYWCHPLVWLAAWRLRVEREIACDDAVLSLGENPSRYASHLLDVASSLAGPACRPSTAVATVTGNSLEKRIRSILHPTLCRKPVGRRAACVLAAGAGVVLLLVALISPMATSSEAPGDGAASQPASAEKGPAPIAPSDAASDSLKRDAPDPVGTATQAGGPGENNREPSSGDAASAEQKESTSDTAAPKEPHVVLQGVVTDPDGEPVAGATVRALTYSDVITAPSTDSQGRFELAVPQSRVRGAILLADWQDGSHQAMHDLGWKIDAAKPLPAVPLVLRPARTIHVQVVDAAQRPVAGASAGATVWYRRIAAGRSDEQGRTTLRVPPDATLKYVYAIKANVGLDYVAYPDPTDLPEDERTRKEQPEPDQQVTLTLDGTVTVRVRLIDPESRPLAGIPVYPWYFQKPNKPDDFNVSGLGEVKVETDARGVAAFDFIPASNEGRITFWARTPEHWAPERPMYDPQSGQEELTVPMVRTVRVTGQVQLPDGHPAPGIEVKAGGAGYQTDRFDESTRTDADGKFEFLAYPDQIYLFIVDDPEWAAPPRTGILIRPDTPVDGVDFRLKPGTKVHGRVTIGPESRPVTDQYMVVYQYGADRHGLPEDQQLPNPTGSRIHVQPIIVRSTRTDAEGRYEFCVGPGTYDVRGPAQSEIQKFSVEDQESITFDFQTPHEDMGLITGSVVRDEDSQPVAGAKVVGIPITERGHADLKETTDEQGRFQKKHWLDKALFYAETSDGQLKGVVEMPAGQQDVTIRVQPVTSARGRLVDATGQPIPDRRIEYGIRIVSPGGSFMHRFGGTARVNASGRFVLEGLVAGQEYHLNVPLHDEDDPPDDWSWRTVGKFTAQGPETTDIGDMTFKAPRRPLTLEERIGSAFDKKTALDERLQGALHDAQLADQRVLVVFADPESDACRQVYHLYYEDSDAMQAFADYRLLSVRTIPEEDADSAAALAARLDLNLADHVQPTLCVLDTDGRLLAGKDASELSKDGRIERDLVTEFLKAHAPEPPDAEKLLADALAQAKREDKRVLVQHTGAYCAPCLLLSRFLDRQKQTFAKDYVHIKIDAHRWRNGAEVINRLRPSEERSIPWMAILDADGQVLITSDGPEGNVGFPSSSGEIEHFLKMLATTARRLDEADLSSLRKALEEDASR